MDDTDPFRTYTYTPRDVECRVCFALIRSTHADAHYAWHHTLSNRPPEETHHDD